MRGIKAVGGEVDIKQLDAGQSYIPILRSEGLTHLENTRMAEGPRGPYTGQCKKSEGGDLMRLSHERDREEPKRAPQRDGMGREFRAAREDSSEWVTLNSGRCHIPVRPQRSVDQRNFQIQISHLGRPRQPRGPPPTGKDAADADGPADGMAASRGRAAAPAIVHEVHEVDVGEDVGALLRRQPPEGLGLGRQHLGLPRRASACNSVAAHIVGKVGEYVGQAREWGLRAGPLR